jgi:hypothetical protein
MMMMMMMMMIMMVVLGTPWYIVQGWNELPSCNLDKLFAICTAFWFVSYADSKNLSDAVDARNVCLFCMTCQMNIRKV